MTFLERKNSNELKKLLKPQESILYCCEIWCLLKGFPGLDAEEHGHAVRRSRLLSLVFVDIDFGET